MYFSTPLCAARRSGFDLPGSVCHGNIGNDRICCFSGPVGQDRPVTGPVRHVNGVKGLRQRTDLIHFDQYGIGRSLLNPPVSAVPYWSQRDRPPPAVPACPAWSSEVPSPPSPLRPAGLRSRQWEMLPQALHNNQPFLPWNGSAPLPGKHIS